MRYADRIDYFAGKIVFGAIGVICLAFTLVLILPESVNSFSKGNALEGSFAAFVGVCFFALGTHLCFKRRKLSEIDC